MSSITVIDDVGRVWPSQVAAFANDMRLGGVDQLEHDRLERQVVTRWSRSETPWDRTATPVAPGLYERIHFNTEEIAGPKYSVHTNRFYPGVPGTYNMKVVLSFTLSEGSVVPTALTSVDLYYRTRSEVGDVGVWQLMGGTGELRTNTNQPIYHRKATVSGSDTVVLTQGMSVEWAYVPGAGANITWYDQFYARMVCERVADGYTTSETS